MKIIRQFFVIVFVITTFMSLLLLTLIGSTQLLFSKKNMIELVKQVDFRELIGYQVEDDIYQLLEQAGLPNQYVDYIIEDQNVREYIGTYLAEGMESLFYRKEPTTIDSNELYNVFVKSMDQAFTTFEEDIIEEDEHLTKQDQQRIHQKLEYYVPKIAEKIPSFETLLETKVIETTKSKDLDQMQLTIRTLQNFYKWKPILSIFILLQLFLIFLLKIRNFKYIKWFMVPFLLTGVALYYFKMQLPPLITHYFPKNLVFMKDFLEQTMQTIYTSWDRTIIICFSLFALFILLQLLIRFARVQQERHS